MKKTNTKTNHKTNAKTAPKINPKTAKKPPKNDDLLFKGENLYEGVISFFSFCEISQIV